MIDALAPVPDSAVAAGWRADLRFFVTCYACGLIGFLVMLS